MDDGTGDERSPLNGTGVVLVDGAGLVVAADAAAGWLLAADGLTITAGDRLDEVLAAAHSCWVLRREPAVGAAAATLTFVHLAPHRGPGQAGGRGRDLTGRPDRESYLAAVVETLDTGVLAFDPSMRPVVINGALRRFHGHEDADPAQWPPRADILLPDGTPVPDDQRLVGRVMRDGEIRGVRMAVRNDRDGRLRQVSVNARLMTGEDGGFAGIVMAVHDVDELVAVQQVLSDRARLDPLTGVVNRHGLADAVDHGTVLHGGPPTHAWVLDVDAFKQVNDLHGHATGDAVLVVVAGALTGAVEGLAGSPVVARLGGDEFAVLAWASLGDVAAEVRRRLSDVDVGQALSVTIGAAHADGRQQSLRDLIAAADDAMYAQRRSHGREHGEPRPPTHPRQ